MVFIICDKYIDFCLVFQHSLGNFIRRGTSRAHAPSCGHNSFEFIVNGETRHWCILYLLSFADEARGRCQSGHGPVQVRDRGLNRSVKNFLLRPLSIALSLGWYVWWRSSPLHLLWGFRLIQHVLHLKGLMANTKALGRYFHRGNPCVRRHHVRILHLLR